VGLGVGPHAGEELPAAQPDSGRDHRQARPVRSSFDGILKPRHLSKGIRTRGENPRREAAGAFWEPDEFLDSKGDRRGKVRAETRTYTQRSGGLQ